MIRLNHLFQKHMNKEKKKNQNKDKKTDFQNKQHFLTREDEEMFKQDNYEKKYYNDTYDDRD